MLWLPEEKISITCPACDRKHERPIPQMFDRIRDACLERLGMSRLDPEDVVHILKNLETMKYSKLVEVMDDVYKSYWNQLMDSITHPGKRKRIRDT